MHITPDEIIYWQYGFFKLNATIVFTWLIMFILVLGAYLITRNLNDQLRPTRWQNGLEVLVVTILQQINDADLRSPAKYIGFLGTLFLFIAMANLLTIFPSYEPPTGSLSTTIALSLCVFISVPLYGIKNQGPIRYLQSYAQPNFFMLPFNIIGELSRTLALAVRLFGNMMSGAMILAILLVISPFVFPIIMSLLGLLTGMVQAYIFFILAAVYIAAATAQDQQSNQKYTSISVSVKEKNNG
ncbi:MAG: F0F1 ATP synthase subunit A [Aliiglaciecola sp.]|uniref:F0F1 ATP synthase subunit A n=1 Tax=Aliiglaciecola sp. TaxID=1872441 RepID=UPI003297D3C6